MEKVEYVIPYYNSISCYYNKWIDLLSCEEENLEELNQEKVLNALLAMVSFDVIFNKEKIVDKKENCNYESKIYEESYKELLDLFKKENNNNDIFSSGAEMLAFVRNKIAHGDLTIDEKLHKLVFNKQGTKIVVDIKSFFDLYIELSTTDVLKLKEKTFTKEILVGSSKTITKPVETEKELEDLLCTMRLKKYTLSRKDGKELTELEKVTFCDIISSIRQTKVAALSEAEKLMIELYEKQGYYIGITKEKIKNTEKIDEIRKSIQNTTENFNKKIIVQNLDYLLFKYQDDIYKIIRDDYKTQGINMGLKLNMRILKNMYVNDNYNLEEVLKSINFKFNISEIITAIDLARFYTLYCYPLEKIYNKDNNYHHNRKREFFFDKIDLSEFEPSVLNIDEKGKKEVDQDLQRVIKNIKILEEKINELEKNINGISKKTNPNEREKHKLMQFKLLLEVKKESLNNMYEQYLDMSNYKQMVYDDYQKNHLYFRNRQIIEGMRNAISHGNVTIEDITTDNIVNKTKIKFSDIYEGNLEFELATDLYSLESLFEEKNIMTNDVFIKFKKLENKYSKNK